MTQPESGQENAAGAAERPAFFSDAVVPLAFSPFAGAWAFVVRAVGPVVVARLLRRR